MLTLEDLQSCEKDQIANLAATLTAADVHQLVEWLGEKDDDIRYKAYLLSLQRSQTDSDFYPYWETFVEKLNSSNSYQRNIGLRLLAQNVRWDASGQFDGLVDRYLSFCDDEKPITVRQCIQSLCEVVPYNKKVHAKIIDKLIAIDLMQRKETQQKLLLLDILSVFAAIQKVQKDERIPPYVHHALTGGLIDKKTREMLQQEWVPLL